MKVSRLIAATAVVSLIALGTAAAFTLRAEDFILENEAGFRPKTLPFDQNAPITVHDAFNISLASGGVPPILSSITYLFDRHGRVDVSGLPTCSSRKLQATDVRTARRVCADAIVGRGSASAIVDLPEQGPFSVSSPITLFNGPGEHGEPTVLAHAYATRPVATTFIVPVTVERARRGVYGFRVEAAIPTISGGYGHLVSLSFEVGRTWRHRYRLHSYVNAHCETGHLDARAEFAFVDGRFLAGSLSQPCTARHR